MDTGQDYKACLQYQNMLTNRKSFTKTLTELTHTNKWNMSMKQVHIDEAIQQEILAGFRKFYDKRHRKYQDILIATGVTFLPTLRTEGCFALITPEGYVTVSKKCKRINIRRDVIDACRGSVHRYIYRLKQRKSLEMDHCNEGGFAAIFETWMDSHEWDMDNLWSYVVHNDPSIKKQRVEGFKTFNEPVLSHWRAYHNEHAELQELSEEEHYYYYS